jgi:hypothetical protein
VTEDEWLLHMVRLAASQPRPWWFPLRLYAYAFGRGYLLGREAGRRMP